MRFRSAKEDLHQTTLAAFRGCLERMEYLAGLRQADRHVHRHADGPTHGQAHDRYEHWGLTRVYGEPAVQGALREAHVAVMDALLRTPMPDIYREAEQRPDIFERLPAELLPPAVDALRAAHFSLVWAAMASVAHRRASHLPAA
jgi:hypothetical protein